MELIYKKEREKKKLVSSVEYLLEPNIRTTKRTVYTFYWLSSSQQVHFRTEFDSEDLNFKVSLTGNHPKSAASQLIERIEKNKIPVR